MPLIDSISSDLRQSLKEKNDLKSIVLRSLIAECKNFQIQERKKESVLIDEEVIKILQKEVKKRIDSIKAYSLGNRDDLAQAEKKELEILQAYLPSEMSEDELKKIIVEIFDRENKDTLNFGTVMKQVMGKIEGRASGDRVKNIVNDLMKSN